MKNIKIEKVEILKVYDYDLGKIYFEDTFKSVEGYKGDLYTYLELNLENICDIFEDAKKYYFEDFKNLEDLKEFFKNLEEKDEDIFSNNIWRQTAFSNLWDILDNKEDFKNKEDFIHFTNLEIDIIYDDIIENIIEEFNGDIEQILWAATTLDLLDGSDWKVGITRGYSQGDYAEVLVNKKEFKAKFGVEFDYTKEQKVIDQVFWDAPISFEAKIYYSLDCENTEIKGVEEYEYDDLEDIAPSQYYNSYDEVEETERKVTKKAVELFNKKFHTSINYEEVKFQEIETY